MSHGFGALLKGPLSVTVIPLILQIGRVPWVQGLFVTSGWIWGLGVTDIWSLVSFIAYVHSLFQSSDWRCRNLSMIQRLIFLRFATSFRVSPFAKTHATDSTRNMTRKHLILPLFLPSRESFGSDLSCMSSWYMSPSQVLYKRDTDMSVVIVLCL